MENANVKVLSKEQCKMSLAFEIAGEKVGEAVEKIFSEIQKEARVPGFRAGKAPMDIIKKEFARTAEERALNRLAAKAAHDYLDEKKIKAAAAPAIIDFAFEPGKKLKFTAEIECHPEISVKNYKKIKVAKKSAEVSEADADERINLLRERNATLAADLTGVATKESFAVVDYTLCVDGKKIENAAAQNHLVDISNPGNIKGLNEALLGAKAGESKEIEIPFPPDYPNPDMRSKTGRLAFTVREIKKKMLPEANDDFAKDVGYENFAALKAAVKESLARERERESRDDARRQIEDALLRNNEFDVPKSIVSEYAKSLLASMKNYFSAHGLSDDEWEKRRENFEKQSADDAKNSVRLYYIYDKIAEAENILVTDEDMKKTRESLAEIYRDKAAEFERRWERDKSQMRHDMLREKIFKFLLDTAAVK